MQKYGVHWFRRDLRLAGNPALHRNLARHPGRVVGFFCFDREFLRRADFSANRFQFFLDTLHHLRDELRANGSDLLVFDVGPEAAFTKLFSLLKQESELPSLVTWNRDYEPFARIRDVRMAEWFKRRSISTLNERDHLLIEPDEIVKRGTRDETYQVYTPFARQWNEIFKTKKVVERIKEQETGLRYLEAFTRGKSGQPFHLKWHQLLSKEHIDSDILLKYISSNRKKISISIPASGSLNAYGALKAFASNLSNYESNRDIPGTQGTSGLSIYLKNGSLTIAQIIAFLRLIGYASKPQDSADRFLSQLIWREFYYHILYHHPNVETEAFIPKYRNINWPNDRKLFRAWSEGRTGFPIVDAGMRQLRETGWMHNRVRMIVASFLTKDLLINWQWGERYFMEQLLDGDLAPNNGGWQWAASTGCDPQPYFRIFNPTLQSRKFDPEARYIKKYLPELADVDNRLLHDPSKFKKSGYPQPVVSHTVQRIRALQLYKSSAS